jgi:hypothetical protein
MWYYAVLYIIGAGLFIIGPNLAIVSDISAIFSDIQRFFYRISLSIVPIIKKTVLYIMSVTHLANSRICDRPAAQNSSEGCKTKVYPSSASCDRHKLELEVQNTVSASDQSSVLAKKNLKTPYYSLTHVQFPGFPCVRMPDRPKKTSLWRRLATPWFLQPTRSECIYVPP